jgi:hypothetical protein
MKKEITFFEAMDAVSKYRTESKEPFHWETAWKKAAASSKIVWPQEIISHKGTYKIEIMQSEDDEFKGIIILSILKDKDLIEGKMISVTDGKGKVLLKSKIQDAHAYNPNLDLKDIDLKLLVNTID